MQLSKFLRYSSRSLTQTLQRGFADAHHHHHKPAISEITDSDLDKFKHLYPGPTKQESMLAVHNLVSHNPLTKSKAFLKVFAENFQDSVTESDIEGFVPPKVHENSVFLYQSRELANEARQFGANEILAAVFVTALMHQPLFFFPTFGVFYYVYGRAAFFELRRRLVTRMDLLPHLEMVQITKTTLFGIVYSKLVKIDDLEKVCYESVKDKENYFWGLNKTHLDIDMIFRDKSTGEYLCFDKKGFWDWKGISHELLN